MIDFVRLIVSFSAGVLVGIWEAMTSPVGCPYQDPACHQRDCVRCYIDRSSE